jgi:hypothetical protein
MANTHGYEVVAEITEAALKNLLKAAWKNGGDTSAEGVIPEKIEIPGPSVPAPVMVGPYTVKSGMVQIPQEQLDLSMDTGINGLRIKLGTIIHLEIQDPPVDAAKLFDLTADVFVRTPLGARNNNEIIADFTALPADAVTVNITSGNPLTPIINESIEQYVHKAYQENKIPHVIDNIPISFLVYSMKCRIDFYDDDSSPAHKIVVSKPDATHIKIEIPCHLRFYDIISSGSLFPALATPMGVNGVAVMTSTFSQTDSHIHVDIPTATVELINLAPAAGEEGTNYNTNKTYASIAGQNLDNLIITGFNANATSQLRAMGPIDIDIPTLAQIEAFAAAAIKTELQRRKQIQIWQVEEVQGTDTPINDVKPQALADSLAIAINNMGGANSGLLNNFIPGSRDFAIATAKEKVIAAFTKERDERYSFPYTYPDKIEGKTVKLNSLDMVLHDGYLEIKGNVTVVDAILDSIDVSADFSQKVTLFWDPDAAPNQKIQHHLDGDPDIDLGAAAWILAALLGFLTFGVIGLVVGLVIVAVVQSVASQIGAQVAAGEADKFENAWPVVLDKIGNVEAHFFNPIVIETSGLVFAGRMTITATNQAALVDMARSHGPYFATGNQAVNFNGGAPHAAALAKWNLGNGQSQSVRSLSYSYGKSGLYVANVQIKVTDVGGATTSHYTRVAIKNVQPVVHFDNPSITIMEGQEIEIKATFTDDNWLDKHIAVFDFGDNTAPQNGVVNETNNEPQAAGTATIKHTWCDSGMYTLTVFVNDDAGGVGQTTMAVQVTNVPPKIIAPKKICVFRHQNVHLEAIFTDPGWCDTHVATWDTGDGHIHMATIKERHTQPALVGYASSSHVYRCIGNYVARVTVTDDDGGVDSAIMFVMVTELFNAHFENGFRIILQNSIRNENISNAVIANEWYPFEQQILRPNIGASDFNNNAGTAGIQVTYKADEFINRDGQRAQVVSIAGGGMAGIRQTVCANKGWDYEFTTYYHLPTVNEQCRLIIGIDADGGTDPSDATIQWVTAAPIQQWVQASVRVCATGEKITCFVGMLQASATNTLYIDKTALFMIQPKYGAIPDRKDEREPCCPVDKIEGHDFNRLEDYKANPTLNVSGLPTYASSQQGVRFSNAETPKTQSLLLMQAPSAKMSDTLIKGASQITGAIVKNLVTGTIQTVFPFLKRKQ